MSVFTGKSALALALAATALTAASPAMARDRYYRGHRGDDAAVAIGAGLVGLAVGAAIASDRDDRYERVYYNDGYYYPRRHYVETYYYGDYPRYRRTIITVAGRSGVALCAITATGTGMAGVTAGKPRNLVSITKKPPRP